MDELNVSDLFVQEAQAGDAQARTYALEIAAEHIAKGEPLSPILAEFIASGLEKIAASEGKNAASAAAFFAKAKREGVEGCAVLTSGMLHKVEAYRLAGYSMTTMECTTERGRPSAYLTVAEEYGLSEKTVETWYRRYRHLL